MSWLESHQELRDHPKTARFRRRLGVTLPAAIGHLHLLWWWALDYAPSGDLARYDADVIADAACWDAEPGVFVRALISAGFLNEDMTIHDWDDYAGRLLEQRAENARRKREERKTRRERRNGTASDSASGGRLPDAASGRPADVRGLPDLTGPDLTEPEMTPPPGPLRTAEGAPALTPITEDDLKLWERARDALTDGWLPSNVEKARAFEPIGRGPDGGLRLRAPSWAGSAMSPHQVRAALVNAGDAAGKRAQIVTGEV